MDSTFYLFVLLLNDALDFHVTALKLNNNSSSQLFIFLKKAEKSLKFYQNYCDDETEGLKDHLENLKLTAMREKMCPPITTLLTDICKLLNLPHLKQIN